MHTVGGVQASKDTGEGICPKGTFARSPRGRPLASSQTWWGPLLRGVRGMGWAAARPSFYCPCYCRPCPRGPQSLAATSSAPPQGQWPEGILAASGWARRTPFTRLQAIAMWVWKGPWSLPPPTPGQKNHSALETSLSIEESRLCPSHVLSLDKALLGNGRQKVPEQTTEANIKLVRETRRLKKPTGGVFNSYIEIRLKQCKYNHMFVYGCGFFFIFSVFYFSLS